MEINIELFKKSSDPGECLLKGTSACAAMNNPDCPACEVGKAGAEAQKNALEDFELLKALLPEEGVRPLMQSDTCLFCKGDKKYPREYYAITDFAHKEPQRTKTSVIGIKVKASVGSLIPVQIACCKKCRRNYLTRDYLPWIITAAVTIVLIVLLSIVPLRESLIAINELLPLAIFAGVFILGFLIGQIARNAFVKAKESQTLFEVCELPIIKKMLEKGWFSLFGEKGSIRLIFSKKRLERGWFSGDSVEA